MQQHKWIGIDVAKDSFEAALSHDGATCSFPNSAAGAKAFFEWAASSLPGFNGHVAMEATGIYSVRLAQYLLNLGAHPAIVNPTHIHAYGRSFGRRNKTDKIDARLITRFANERQPRLWERPDEDVSRLRELIEHRDDIKLEQDKLSKQLSTIESPSKLMLKRHKDNENYLKKVEAEIRKLERSHPRLAQNIELMKSIPGIGEWTARAILAYTNNLTNFTRRSLAAYCGLAPCVHHSGTYTGGGHIPHTGPRLIKKYLYMAAQTNTKSCIQNPLANFYRHLKKNQKSGKQALCALMRKMLLIARAVILNQKPYSPQLEVTNSE